MPLHRYFVDWAAPNYKKAGNITVMAKTKPDAIAKAKKKLGKKVKAEYLHHFDAVRLPIK